MSESPANWGCEKLFDLADAPDVKRAAIERLLMAEMREILTDWWAAEKFPIALLEPALAKAQVAIQPRVDAWFLALVD